MHINKHIHLAKCSSQCGQLQLPKLLLLYILKKKKIKKNSYENAGWFPTIYIIYINIYMCVCVCVYTHTHAHTHTHTHTYIYEFIFIFKVIYYIIYIFKAKERKQYQNNGTENLFVVIMYLIEAFKMRLLSIAESFESP